MDRTEFDARFEAMSRSPAFLAVVLATVVATVPFWLAAAALAVVTVLILMPCLYLVPAAAGALVGGGCALRYPGMASGGLAGAVALGSLPQALATVAVLSGLTTIDPQFESNALWTWILLSFPLTAAPVGAVAALATAAATKLVTGRG